MARVRVREPARGGVEHEVHEGHELLVGEAGGHHAVKWPQSSPGAHPSTASARTDGLEVGHQERGGQALSGHVRDAERDAARADLEHVIVVAAQPGGRLPRRGDAVPGWCRELTREQRRLYLARRRQFALVQLLRGAPRSAGQHVRAQRGQELVVVPRLAHEVADAVPEALDGEVHGGPGRHDHHGHVGVAGADGGQEVETLLAGGRAARVVEVHQHEVERRAVERFEQRRRRADGLRLVVLRLQEQAQGFPHLGLVVGDEDAR